MINRLMTASAIVLVSAGLAVAQTAAPETGAAPAGQDSSQSSTFQWDQTSQGAFFNDNAIRSDSDVRAAFDALDTEQQAQLRSDCQQFASAGTGGSGLGNGSSTGSAMGGATALGGSADTTAGAAPNASGTDNTQTSSTTGSAGTTTSGTSASAMPDMASMEQLCAQVQSY